MEAAARDVAAAKNMPRDRAMRVLAALKAAHADWFEDHHLSTRELRRAGSPFTAAYNDLERWLQGAAAER